MATTSDWGDERAARLEAIEQLRGLACDMQRGAASFWEVARWPPLMAGMSDSDREAFLARKLSQAADAYSRSRAVVYALQELEQQERTWGEIQVLLWGPKRKRGPMPIVRGPGASGEGGVREAYGRRLTYPALRIWDFGLPGWGRSHCC